MVALVIAVVLYFAPVSAQAYIAPDPVSDLLIGTPVVDVIEMFGLPPRRSETYVFNFGQCSVQYEIFTYDNALLLFINGALRFVAHPTKGRTR
jgi:hypothetical protein